MITQSYKENLYDETGIAGMIYNSSYYTFEKNILGDVIAVVNSNNQEVARYVYDAWGNVISQSGSMADKNPFRYRGYYYDTETGFYYLQSRYYDPSIRRFINADDHSIIGTLSQSAGEVNLYAYCCNNPVMYTDESGQSLLFVLFLTAFTLVGAGVGLGIGLSKGHEGWQLVGDIALGAATGLMTGGLVASTWGAMSIVFGWGNVLGITAKVAFTLGAATYNFMGIIISSIKRVKFQPIEMNPIKDKHDPQLDPPAIIRTYGVYMGGGEI